jgi:hypothetical protein
MTYPEFDSNIKIFSEFIGVCNDIDDKYPGMISMEIEEDHINEIIFILKFFVKYKTNRPITLNIHIDVNNKRELNKLILLNKLQPYINHNQQRDFLRLIVTHINEDFLSILCKLNKEVSSEVIIYVEADYRDLDAQKLKDLFKYKDKISIFFNDRFARHYTYSHYQYIYDEINNSKS